MPIRFNILYFYIIPWLRKKKNSFNFSYFYETALYFWKPFEGNKIIDSLY